MKKGQHQIVDTAPVRIREALGQSEAFLTFQERLSRVAAIDRPVLLVGERGTGKELAAARLHYLSNRWGRPLVTLNCAALSPGLIESELFGYEAGAFTGAERRRVGRFEAAHRGTLFLDEIGTIPAETQEKILRVIEYGVFERVGSAASIRVDVRIIGATNADLPGLVDQGRFKADLLDRLSFDVLFLPPLRVRHDDIMLLANHFAARMAFDIGRDAVPQFGDDAVQALEAYPWPGNVRELKNVVERAVCQADSDVITHIVFNPFRSPFAPRTVALADQQDAMPVAVESQPDSDRTAGKTFAEAVRQLEVRLVTQALQTARYNQRQAAQALGLTYHQFRGLYRKYRDVVAR